MLPNDVRIGGGGCVPTPLFCLLYQDIIEALFVAGGVQGRAKHLSEESRQITQSPTTLFKNTPLHLSAY